MPEGEVDAGFIPGGDPLRALGPSAAERVGPETLERVHVVFAFAGTTLLGAGEMGEEVRPQIEQEEVPRGFLAHHPAAIEVLWVVDGGGMTVTVTGENGEVLEFGNGSKGGDAGSGHQRSETGIGRGEVLQAAFALESLEKETDREIGTALVAMTLKEVATRAGVAHTP